MDAIFGPSSIQTSGIVAAIAETFEIPHLIYHWKTKPLYWEKSYEHGMTLNLYPDSEVLAEAFADVLVDYSWASYTIIYENKENLIRLKDILQIPNPKSMAINLRQLTKEEYYGSMLKEINARGDFYIVLDISTERIIPFLTVASEFNMLGDYNKYFITNLDAHLLDLSEIPELTSNITCLRLVNPDGEIANALSLWQQGELEINIDASHVPLEAGLVQDALQIFYNSLEANGAADHKTPTPKHNCSEPERKAESYFGLELVNFLRTQELDGITGNVQFDKKGNRKQFQLEILELSRYNFSRIGYWNTTDRVMYDREIESPEQIMIEAIQNKTFLIAVKIGEPYLMLQQIEYDEENDVTLEGNARYEGYIVDLINIIQQNLNFRYELEVVADGKYGNFDPETKKWNGLVRQLIDRKADLAIGDLTITKERETVIDFTSPFMNLGIGVLYIRPPKFEPNLLSFLDPFSLDVWLCIWLSCFGIATIVLILTRISEDDWQTSETSQENLKEMKNIFNFSNCIWLAISCLTISGCSRSPK